MGEGFWFRANIESFGVWKNHILALFMEPFNLQFFAGVFLGGGGVY